MMDMAGKVPTSKSTAPLGRTIYYREGYSISSYAGQYIYNMPRTSWMVCWIIAGLADKDCVSFSYVPAEIRYIIMDNYFGVSSGTGISTLGAYLALRTEQIYWWEPHIYSCEAGGQRITLNRSSILIPEEIIYANRSGAIYALFLRIMNLVRPPTVETSKTKVYNVLVTLRDRILTHPRAIEITSRMIDCQCQHTIAQNQK